MSLSDRDYGNLLRRTQCPGCASFISISLASSSAVSVSEELRSEQEPDYYWCEQPVVYFQRDFMSLRAVSRAIDDALIGCPCRRCQMENNINNRINCEIYEIFICCLTSI